LEEAKGKNQVTTTLSEELTGGPSPSIKKKIHFKKWILKSI
jgi:hypothetical protein